MSTERIIETVGHEFRMHGVEGRPLQYVNLDNSASTPPAVEVAAAVADLGRVYGSVQRGAGLKSLLSTTLYENALEVLRRFAGGAAEDVVVPTGNTTMAINRLAANYGFREGDIVLVSDIEHSSNDLPWRRYARVLQTPSTPSGRCDLDALERTMMSHGGKIRVVALTAASNTSGYLPPVREAAEIAHRHGAEVFLDCAQLVAHRPIAMRRGRPEQHFDYVAFSGHKMYAPYGAGVLVGKRAPFERGAPDLPGGGTIDMLAPDRVLWSPLPARLTPGTPNVVGIVAMAIAAQLIEGVGAALREHDDRLVQVGLRALGAVPGLKLHGQSAFAPGEDRLPIFSFSLRGYEHALLAAILGNEYGVGLRSGHLCQYEFMRRELQISAAAQASLEDLLGRGDKSRMYGMVRASCAGCTAPGDLSSLASALEEIVRRGPRLAYEQDRSSGQYFVAGRPRSSPGLVPESLRALARLDL